MAKSPDKFYHTSKCLSNVFPAETTRLFEYLKELTPKKDKMFYQILQKQQLEIEHYAVGAFNILSLWSYMLISVIRK